MRKEIINQWFAELYRTGEWTGAFTRFDRKSEVSRDRAAQKLDQEIENLLIEVLETA